MLHTQLARDAVEKFRDEARILAHLVHPHIIRVLDFGVEGSIPFLVMDYAPNDTVRQLCPKGTQMPLPTVVSYVQQIASALQYAHDEKFIHRDVKPENVLVGKRHEVLLSDFGIAVLSQSWATQSQSLQSLAGTPCYMAPEQFQGKPSRASDQYALGVMAYEWLSGDPPFKGSLFEVMGQHLHASPPPLRDTVPGIPPTIKHIIERALAKVPDERFASVWEFAMALEQASRSLQDNAPPQAVGFPAIGEVTQPMSEPALSSQETLRASQTQTLIKFLPRLTELDNLVMKLLCEEAIVEGHYWVNAENLLERAEAVSTPSEEYFETLRILGRRRYIEIAESFGGHISLVKIRVSGFERYARAYISDYDALRDAVIFYIVRDYIWVNKELATLLRQPLMLINHILHHLAGQGLIDVVETFGNHLQVTDVSPELRRTLKEKRNTQGEAPARIHIAGVDVPARADVRQPIAAHTPLANAVPRLVPVGAPVFQEGHPNWLKWDADEQHLSIRNIGTGAAFNVESTLYGCESYVINNHHPDGSENLLWTCWLGVPIAPGEHIECAYKRGGGMFFEEERHIGEYHFNTPAEPTFAELNHGASLHLARIVLTYHDDRQVKYASICDYVPHTGGWHVIAFLSNIKDDLSDLQRRSLEQL